MEGVSFVLRKNCDHMTKAGLTPATIIATGGLAQFITPLCKREIILEKDLLLKGLNIIYKKNKK